MKTKILLFSLTAFIVGLMATAYVSYIFKSSMVEAQKTKLHTLVHSSASHINTYFKSLENIVDTLSKSDKVLNSFELYKNSFYEIKQIDHDNFKFKAEINLYYKQNFFNRIQSDVPNSNKIKTLDKYIPKSDAAITLQTQFIIKNPFNLGEKEKLYEAKNFDASYNTLHKKLHPYFINEQSKYGFYDIFLIDTQGNIIYSVEKETDYATNLYTGPYSDSTLASAFKKAINIEADQLVFEDFGAYEPSYNNYASFMAKPLIRNGRKVGVLAVQVPVKKIDNVLSFNNQRELAGLGKSGELYIVGSDFLMRSNSRFIDSHPSKLVQKNRTTVGIVKVNTTGVREGLHNKTGSQLIKDYRGVDVFSAYMPLNIFGNNWVLLAETDKQEVMKTINKNTIILFVIASIIMGLFIALFMYIIQKNFINPLEEDVKIQEKNVFINQSLLNEYKKAVDASAIVSKTNLNGRITYVNDAFCELSGYSKEELIGNPHNIIRHPDTPKQVFKELWETIQNKDVWNGIIKNKKKNGENYYVHNTIVPILDENGELKEYMSIRSEVTDLINKERTILKQTTDETTGLPNRIKLSEDISSSESEMKLALIHFKDIRKISDFYGEPNYKELVKNISLKIKTLAEVEQANLYTISSDEFAIFVSRPLPVNDFVKMCESIQHYFDHNNFKIADHDDIHLATNIGLSASNKNIYINAERALYYAEESGKALVSYEQNTDIEKNFENNKIWVAKIKEAIREDRIVPFAQPIISNINSNEEKYECLMRLIEKDGTIVSPFYFLETAKEARLYSTLTQIIIEKSFQHFSGKTANFSINLTIDDIMNKSITDFLEESIIKYNIGSQLILEIVESEGIENFDEISTFISHIKKYGCKIAIDDFGTGYSNFEYLIKLNTDFIKIDGSLIKNISKDKSSLMVVELIIDFAKKLNMKVIGEYVSTKETLEKVKELKIDYSQGYYLGEPKQIK